MVKTCQNVNDPVDGSEIRPSPVEVGSEYPIIYKDLYIKQGGCAGFLNHQQSQHLC